MKLLEFSSSTKNEHFLKRKVKLKKAEILKIKVGL